MPQRRIAFALAAALLALPAAAHAQAHVVGDTLTFQKARVIAISNERTEVIIGTDTPSRTQTITAVLLDGANTGSSITFENDYTQLRNGEVFYARHSTNALDDRDVWSVADPYRLDVLGYLATAFVILTLYFGGKQGARGLASLIGSIALIFLLLIPGILHGYSPILVSLAVASLIIVLGSYVTHGFNRTTSSAVLGMIGAVLLTGAAAYLVVHMGNLSGYASEEAVYLNFDTRGGIDMIGLLFGSIMIGLLGVLYDIAIGQAIAVEELYRAGVHMTRLQVYARAIRIGREHIGALVNTLAIAYVGAALPLLLLISNSSDAGVLFTLNNEIFATEIVRILIGSIGLILGVPITTLIASYMLTHLRGASSTQAHHH